MQYSTLHDSLSPVENRPRPDSLDSAYEFSLARLLEVHRLVDAEDQPSTGTYSTILVFTSLDWC
jgi:hypothetical protein